MSANKVKQSITVTEGSIDAGLEIAVRSRFGHYATFRLRKPQEAVNLATTLLMWARRANGERRDARQRARKAS